MWWLGRAVQWQWNAYRQSRGQPGGPADAAFWLFLPLPFTVLYSLVCFARHDPGRGLGFLAISGGLLLLCMTAAGWRITVIRGPAPARVPYSVSSPEAMEERAAVLEALEAVQARAEPSPPDEAVDQARQVAALLSVKCPDGPEGCGRPPGRSCSAGTGESPLVIIQRGDPPLFCHMCRIAVAIVSGAADEAQVRARFSGGEQ